MDIFDRAQGFLDKAQEKVADATTLAAWHASKAVRQRTVQNQKEEVEKQIGTTTMQLGHRVYQLWKNRGGRDDPGLEELCRALDNLLGRYREVNAEMSEIANTTFDGVAIGPRSAGPAGTATVLPAAPASVPQHAQVVTPAPRQDLPRPATPAPAPPPPRQEPVEPPAATRRPPAPAPVAPPQAAVEPARPASKPKPCPSCGTTVPADMMYCPHCGYMAR